MKVYQISEWDENFENNKSRERDECSFVCIPNSQSGLGFSRIVSDKDGAMIYGIFVMIAAACSRQRKPRNGWLTHDGHQTGTPWALDDLAVQFRRSEAEISKALDFLSSAKVGWLLESEVTLNDKLTQECPAGARVVPGGCPSGALEGKKERRKERSAREVVIPIELDTEDFRKAWLEWIEVRSAKRKPVGGFAAEKQLKKLAGFGVTGAIQSISDSIANDWQGLFEPRAIISHHDGRGQQNFPVIRPMRNEQDHIDPNLPDSPV